MTVYIKVEIPQKEEPMADLIAAIAKRHQEEGSNSPITGDLADMVEDHSANIAALAAEVKSLTNRLAIATQRFEKALGLDGSVRLTGTSLYVVTTVRDTLLAKYKGVEHEMNGWGYNVSVTKGGRKSGSGKNAEGNQTGNTVEGNLGNPPGASDANATGGGQTGNPTNEEGGAHGE